MLPGFLLELVLRRVALRRALHDTDDEGFRGGGRAQRRRGHQVTASFVLKVFGEVRREGLKRLHHPHTVTFLEKSTF